MDKLQETLHKIGVEGEPAKIFQLLYRKGPQSVVSIARETRIHRTRVYTLLNYLRTRGFVDEIKIGKRIFHAAIPPEKLRDMVTRTLSQIDRDFPLLRASYRKNSDRPLLTTFVGREGLIEVFADLVNATKIGEVFIRVSSEADRQRAQTYFPITLRRIRDKKRLERLVIASALTWEGSRPPFGMAQKLIPLSYDAFQQNVITLVYANKTAIIDIEAETAYVIESARISDFYRKTFSLLHRKLPS